MLLDGPGFGAAVERLADGIGETPDLIAAIEARGFVFGAALAQRLGCGLLLIRKHGKLPGATISEEYALEYGTDRLAIHVDACAPGAAVHLIDDLIATGGTAMASVRLLRKAGALVTGASFVVDLPDLGGADLLRAEGVPVRALIPFPGH